ncbi:MAG: DUF2268 domain-containing putative Zn-dependent protease [Candidatus Baltobacteraceae bacterium]
MASVSLGNKNTLTIDNRVPRFQRFYESATKDRSNESKRWALWKQEYNFAAVPPTADGDLIARTQLDAAWSKYTILESKLSADTKSAELLAQTTFYRVVAILDPQATPVHARLLLFVGQFDNNAFSVPAMDGKPPTSVIPVEAQHLDVLLAHELSHAVDFQLAHVKNSFGAPIGETMFLEGLAMRSSQRVLPGRPEATYTSQGDQGWLHQCYARKQRILQGIVPYLDVASQAAATTFTFGNGTTGMHREVYCAAWIATGRLLSHGHSLAELATIPEKSMSLMMRATIQKLLIDNRKRTSTP